MFHRRRRQSPAEYRHRSRPHLVDTCHSSSYSTSSSSNSSSSRLVNTQPPSEPTQQCHQTCRAYLLQYITAQQPITFVTIVYGNSRNVNFHVFPWIKLFHNHRSASLYKMQLGLRSQQFITVLTVMQCVTCWKVVGWGLCGQLRCESSTKTPARTFLW